jgi:hypothetical protein
VTVAGLRPADLVAPLATLEELRPSAGCGLVIGQDRRSGPVPVRLFRPDRATNAVLVGSIRAALLVAFRALGSGARVVVRTGRPQTWSAFGNQVGADPERFAVVPPGVSDPIPATARLPRLVVVDTGPAVGAGAQDQPAGERWQSTLVIREELSAWDVDNLTRADLAILQPLGDVEASLAASALGLAEARGWLTRIRGDMIGLASAHRITWARFAPTVTELQLIGPPGR